MFYYLCFLMFLKHFELRVQTASHVLMPLSSVQVGVPVKFNGGAGVQVRTPHNLADLAAYTSLKFYITLPEAARTRRQDNSDKQFIFYLGNKDVSITNTEPILCVVK